ncbi:MAG: hypothetical protein ACREQN_11925 [Candidatus Binataceae bacterium]
MAAKTSSAEIATDFGLNFGVGLQALKSHPENEEKPERTRRNGVSGAHFYSFSKRTPLS